MYENALACRIYLHKKTSKALRSCDSFARSRKTKRAICFEVAYEQKDKMKCQIYSDMSHFKRDTKS
jgi:hypothetical protein